MRDVGIIVFLLVFSYLIFPAVVFVHGVAFDCLTVSDNTSTDMVTKVMVTPFVLLFWGLIIFFAVRSDFMRRHKSKQGQTTLTVTYVPEKKGD